MSWNYRVFRHKTHINEEPYYYAIHEAYFDGEEIPHSCTLNEVGPSGSNVEELRWVLEEMLKAAKEPILEYDDISNEIKQVEK